MRRWSKALIIPLGALLIAGGPDTAWAAAPMRAGAAAHPLAPRVSRIDRIQGVARRGSGDRTSAGRALEGGGRFADVYGDDLGYGLAGGFVGAAGAQSGADGPIPYDGPPYRGPFPGRPPYPAPCMRPQVITIGRGVRAADKIRVVYGAPPPCGP